VADLDKLKEHMRAARVIIDERGLYDIWERIPESGDSDFQNNSFNQFVKQGIYPGAYTEWARTLEDLFFINNLDYLKFKSRALTGDGRKTNKQPAAIFVRQVKELERIIDDPATLKSYETTEKLAASWPPITFKDGVVTQGSRVHVFTTSAANRLLETLWQQRRTETPSGQEIVTGKAIDRAQLHKAVGLKDHQRFVDVVTGIHKSMRAKGIHLTVKYPDRVILVVRQDRI
jgi:hypothetical protein